MTTGSKRSAPSAARCTPASCRKASVTISAVGTPRPSSATASCRLHDVQEPQSPIAVTATSVSAAIRSSRAGGARREKPGFA